MRMIYVTIAALIFSSCIDQIEFESPKNIQDAISIQARLVHSTPSILNVEVKRLFDFTGIPLNIKVRSIELTNTISGQSMTAVDAGVNQYRIIIPDDSPDMDINYEDSYSLTVETLDSKIFVSTPEKLVRVPRGNQLSHTIIEKLELDLFDELSPVDFIQYEVDGTTMVDNIPTRLRWTFEQAFILTDEPEDLTIEPKSCYTFRNLGSNVEANYDPYLTSEFVLSGLDLIDVRIDDAYAEGNYTIAYQQSLSVGAYEYFKELKELISSEGNLFDPPPGKIRTNFSDIANEDSEVFGYFYITEIDTLRHFIAPEEVQSPRRRCPPVFSTPPPRECFVISCCDCLEAPNSQLEKPEWWTN